MGQLVFPSGTKNRGWVESKNSDSYYHVYLLGTMYERPLLSTLTLGCAKNQMD